MSSGETGKRVASVLSHSGEGEQTLREATVAEVSRARLVETTYAPSEAALLSLSEAADAEFPSIRSLGERT